MTPRQAIVLVVRGLVGLTFAGLLGILVLAVLGKPIPDVLQNVTIGSMTAVAGILSKTSTDDGGKPREVEVVNAPDEPVPTRPAAAVRPTPPPPAQRAPWEPPAGGA